MKTKLTSLFIVALCAVAMSFGAWADTKTYALTYELQNIPKQVEGHPDHDFIYLADTNGNVFCYVDRGSDMTKDGDNWKLNATTIDHAAGSTTYLALAGKTVVAHKLTAATIEKSGTSNGRVFSVTFTSEYDLGSAEHVTWYDQKVGATLDMIAVLTNSEGDESCEEYKVDSKPGANRTGPEAGGYTIKAHAEYPFLSLEAFDAVKIYDGLPTNATYTVDQGDATITVAYSEGSSAEGPFGDEEVWNPVKFKNCIDLYARFTATKKGYKEAEAVAHVWISYRQVAVTAPDLTFPLDAEDDAIDAEIESNIDIEKAGLIPEHGVLDGDEITYKWAREEASYKDGSREGDVDYEITFPDEGEYEDYNVNYQGNYIVNYVGGTLKFKPMGRADNPWVVGGDVSQTGTVVEAWTNGAEFVIKGTGTVKGLEKIPSGVKGGITAINITESTVTGAESEAFKGFSNVSLTLPDGWQGELPEKGVWYGATDVELVKWPLAVKNVKSQQRYPWNGLVDVSCDLSGSGEVTLAATVLTNGVKFIEAKALTGETTVDLGDGKEMKGLKFIWNAAEDLPAGFKAGVQVKVTVEK